MKIGDAMERFSWLKEILHELPPELLEQIQIQHFKPNSTIVEHCESNYYTIIILEGVCCTCQNTENGTQFVLRKATVGDVVGFAGIYQDRPAFSACILARTQVTAAILPRPLVLECLGKYPSFSIHISRRVILCLQSMVNLLSECNNYPSYLGLATYLEYNYLFYAKLYPENYSGKIQVMESRKNIADFLGVDVRSVQRLLGRMKKEGFVSTSSRNIYIEKRQYEMLQKLRYDWFLNDH